MKTDEAMQAVKKAVEFIPYLEARVDLSNRNPKRLGGETIEEILLAALRAIAPGGPLVVVRREPTEAFMDEESGVETIYRAMIAEGEKS